MNETAPPTFSSAPQPKTPALAIWSLVLGILGVLLLLVCIGPLFAIPGVVCGHMAYSRIKRSSGALAGEGMALAGLITSYISIGMAIFLVPMMMAIAIPNFVRARETAQENACINNLRQIDAAKQQWALERGAVTSAQPQGSDIQPYLGRGDGVLPTCPIDPQRTFGTSYLLQNCGTTPTCQILPATHFLP